MSMGTIAIFGTGIALGLALGVLSTVLVVVGLCVATGKPREGGGMG